MKTCSKCKESKSLTEFGNDKRTKDGLNSNCRICFNSIQKVHYIKNKNKILLRQKIRYENNKDAILDSQKVYYESNKNKKRLSGVAWSNVNKDRIILRKKVYSVANREKINANKKLWVIENNDKVKNIKKKYRNLYPEKNKNTSALWRLKNPEKAKESNRSWRLKNPEKAKAAINFGIARRRSSKLQATPKWLTEEHYSEILYFYTLAQELAWLNQNGKPFHVDHIIPLRGENVSGLHVPWNLQLMSAEENLKKGNTYE